MGEIKGTFMDVDGERKTKGRMCNCAVISNTYNNKSHLGNIGQGFNTDYSVLVYDLWFFRISGIQAGWKYAGKGTYEKSRENGDINMERWRWVRCHVE